MPEQNKKLFLLDAFALIYRAHFAFITNPRISSKGINTSAIFGFTNSLLEILEKENPTHLGIAFDLDGPTFRHEEYKEYKINRDARPEDITIAIPLVKKLAEAFNIPVLEVAGYEADDIIGTLAKKAARQGFTVYMMTPDKDFAQLVEDDVIFLYRPARMKNPAEIWGEDRVKEKFGIQRIDQVIDIQGLMGDSIDNIPGIPGIGPKTAEKLIKQFDTVENLLASTDQLKGKQKENIEAHADQALLSKKLARIKLDVPIDFDPEALEVQPPDKEKIEQLFAELEFKALGKRVLGEGFKPKNVKKTEAVQQDLFADIPVIQEKIEETKLETLADQQVSYQLVETQDQIKSLVAKLESSGHFAFDIISSYEDPLVASICGFSFSMTKNQAFYVPLPKDKKKANEILAQLKPLFEKKDITKIGHNLKFDNLLLRNAGIPLNGEIVDNMIAHYLIEPELTYHGINLLAEKYLHYATIPITRLIGEKGRGQKKIENLEPEKIKDYACENADLGYQLKNILEPELKKEDFTHLYKKIECPLISVLADMEYNGVKIDKQNLAEYSKELGYEMLQLEGEIVNLAGVGRDFNLNSPKQLGELLFDHLKLNPKAKKTRKSGQYSTSEDILLKLAHKHEIVKKILDYRSLQKLKSTYVDALPLLINSDTGRIHTTFQQAVTATGRLSSTNPNLQNIPIRTEKGRYIRKAFVPEDDNYLLLSADYSQIELRLIASISDDQSMLQAFSDGLDIHASTAAKVFSVSIDEVTPNMRRQAKTVNFGIIYGISAFGLAERLEIPRREAAEIIDNYFEKFPRIKEYMNKTIQFARDNGYVKTLMGRKRTLRDINSRNPNQRGYAERNAINSPIQGSAADMIKIAMVRIYEEMKKRKMQSKMILQVHDELVFDAHKDEQEELRNLVEGKMKTALDLDVPIVVETGFGENWLEAH